MRLQHLANYWYLLRHFRNAPSLIRDLRGGPVCREAVEWRGVRLVHPPGQGGLVGTLVELWIDECYTHGGFYRPRAGDVIVDAGAHIGLFSIWMARQGAGSRIVALEPFPENHRCLVENVRAAGLHQIDTRRLAVGGHDGYCRIEARTDRSIDHRMVPAEEGQPGAVPTCTIAGLFDLARTKEIAFLKLDVEGAEHEAFQQAPSSVLGAIERIALEYHDNLVPGTLRLLKERLRETHEIEVFPTEDRGYGILRARRKH